MLILAFLVLSLRGFCGLGALNLVLASRVVVVVSSSVGPWL